MDEEITKLQVDNKGLKEELLSMKSELSGMNDKMRHSNNSSKLNEVLRNQNVLKDGLSDIRLSLKSFVESVSDILSSVIDEVQTNLSGRDCSTRQEPQADDVVERNGKSHMEPEPKGDDVVERKGKSHMEPEPKGDDVVERKGKSHMEPEPKGDDVVEKNDKDHVAPESSHHFHDDYVLDFPSFDLGVGNSQNSKSSTEFFASEEVQEQVDEAIARVLESTECHTKDVSLTIHLVFRIINLD
jgi:hypothetical protein